MGALSQALPVSVLDAEATACSHSDAFSTSAALPPWCCSAAARRYQEETKKAIESINAVMAHLGAAAAELLTDTNKLLMLVAGGSALALGVYGAREGARVAGKAAERWLGTPKLVRKQQQQQQAAMRQVQQQAPVGMQAAADRECAAALIVCPPAPNRAPACRCQVRETSRRALVSPSALLPAAAKSVEAVKRDFSDIILPGPLHDRVRSLAASAANTKLHGAPYRHMLFYGAAACHTAAAC